MSCSLTGVRNGTPALILSGVVLGTVFFTRTIFPSKEKRKSRKKENLDTFGFPAHPTGYDVECFIV